MSGALRRVWRPLADRATYRRWAFLVLGGALLAPYLLLANAVGVLASGLTDRSGVPWIVTAVGTLGALVATGSVPAVRAVMTTGATELLRGPLTGVTPARGRAWPDRVRACAWLLVHVVVGGAVSLLSLAVPILAVVAFVAPFAGPDLLREVLGRPLPAAWQAPWTPVAGALGVLVLLYIVAGVGGALARLGPVLLGPSPEERVTAAERRAADLAQRNRLARELHDSVGHALSIVTTQAAAAGRVLADDPEFARQALTAIESQARMALEDLDHVLGLLREGEGWRESERERERAGGRGPQDTVTTPQPTLAALDTLLADVRATGMDVDAEVTGALDRVPRVVSREAYRIVQECLTNALRHAAGARVDLRVAATAQHLAIDVRNPLTGRAASRSPGGGRGLAGITERVALLGGQMTAEDADGWWRVRVRVPVGVTR
jgi:signal transduction histidine kinase